MRSSLLARLRPALILISLAPSLAACETTRVTEILAAVDCQQGLTAKDRQHVPGAKPPTVDELTGPGGQRRLAQFGDEQTGQLDKANGRGDDIIAKVDECHRIQGEVLKAVTPKKRWWWPF